MAMALRTCSSEGGSSPVNIRNPGELPGCPTMEKGQFRIASMNWRLYSVQYRYGDTARWLDGGKVLAVAGEWMPCPSSARRGEPVQNISTGTGRFQQRLVAPLLLPTFGTVMAMKTW